MHLQSIKLAKKGVIGLLCGAFFAPAISYGQSLEEAVAATFESHPELRATYTRFKASEKQVEQAEAAYFPTIDATAGIGYEYTDSPTTRRTDDDTESLVRRELGIGLTQEVFSGFLTQSEVERTSYATSAEQWRLYAAAEDLALEVSQVYLAFIEAKQVVALSNKNYASHEIIYEQIKERTDSGFGSSADLSQIEARLASARSNLIAAQNNYLDSSATFYRVVAQEPENLVIPYPDAAMLPATKEEGLKIALDNHPVIKSAYNDINAASAQHESANSNYYPRVWIDLDANFNDNVDGVDGRADNDVNVGGDNNEVIAMLRLSYNLFSGGQDEAFSKETAYQINEAKELNRTVHRDVVEGFTLSWNAFEQLNLQKKYIKQNVIASKKTQVAYEEQFKLGQRSLLDLLDTENELFEARRDFLNTEFSEIAAQYRILNAMGLLVDALRVTRPNSWLGEEQFEGGVTK